MGVLGIEPGRPFGVEGHGADGDLEGGGRVGPEDEAHGGGAGDGAARAMAGGQRDVGGDQDGGAAAVVRSAERMRATAASEAVCESGAGPGAPRGRRAAGAVARTQQEHGEEAGGGS
jgi:hypothetical protein